MHLILQHPPRADSTSVAQAPARSFSVSTLCNSDVPGAWWDSKDRKKSRLLYYFVEMTNATNATCSFSSSCQIYDPFERATSKALLKHPHFARSYASPTLTPISTKLHANITTFYFYSCMVSRNTTVHRYTSYHVLPAFPVSTGSRCRRRCCCMRRNN